MSQQSYDQIATVYATDMGQSMAFDDVGYYRRLCLARGGAVLELGCGTGRILLPLLAAGIDIEGVDQSEGMLRQLRADAAALGLQPSVHTGSLQHFAVPRTFRTILAPYSVITYLTTAADLARFWQTVREVLAPDGLLILDTFIPRPVTPFNDFRLDYRRPHGTGTLQREKRITCEGPCNHIERRYTLLTATGDTERSWTTLDTIHPYTRQALLESAASMGFHCLHTAYDYDAKSAGEPQFMVLHFGPMPGHGQ